MSNSLILASREPGYSLTTKAQSAVKRAIAMGGDVTVVFDEHRRWTLEDALPTVVVDRVLLRGESIYSTALVIGAGLAGKRMISFAGTALGDVIIGGGVTHLTIENTARTVVCDALSLEHHAIGTISNLRFDRINGNCIDFRHSWDFQSENIVFYNSGSAAKPVVNAQDSDFAGQNEGGVNNISAINWHTEGHFGTGLRLGVDSRKWRLIGCKWHGLLPTANEVGHVLMEGAEHNQFIGCHTAKGKLYAVKLAGGSSGNVFIGGMHNGQETGWTFDIEQGDDNILVGNAIGLKSAGAGQAINVTAGAGNREVGTITAGTIQGDLIRGAMDRASATADRPTNAYRSQMVFDTTLNKPVWYDGAAWRDAAGAVV